MHLAGRTTAFWQAMKKYKVNLYLAGEVHATTRRSMNGITQITTGAPLSYTGQTTFVAVDEYPDHLGLVDWGWNVPENAPTDPSWDGACAVSAIEANRNACPPGRVVPMNYDYTGYAPSVEGTLSISPDNTADYGTGNLIEYVNPPTPVPPAEHAAVSLQGKAAPTSVRAAGKPVTYSYRVSNAGNLALSTVAVRTTTFSGKGDAPLITCPQDSLPVGVSETCTARYTVTAADVAAGAPVTDVATAGGVSSTGSAVSSEKATSAVAMPSLPSMSLTARASVRSIGKAQKKVTYTYAVRNTGNTALTAVKVRRLTHTGAGVWSVTTCPTSGLELGATTTCTATYTSTQADVEAGKAVTSTVVAGARSPHSAVSSNTAKASTPVSQRPSLSLTARASTGSVRAAGQKVTFRFAVENNGNLTLKYLHVNAGLSGRGRRSSFSYPTTTLAPGARTTVTMVYTVAEADIAAGQPIASTSTVTGRRFATARKITSPMSRARVAVR